VDRAALAFAQNACGGTAVLLVRQMTAMDKTAELSESGICMEFDIEDLLLPFAWCVFAGSLAPGEWRSAFRRLVSMMRI